MMMMVMYLTVLIIPSDVFCLVEGAVGSDMALAGVLWRNLFEMNCNDVAQLELMVDYVRRQVSLCFQIYFI